MAVILPTGWADFAVGECCVDSTERGQQLIVQELAFDQLSTINGVRRTSWSHVSEDHNAITLIGNASCGGGNMSYQQVAPPPDPICCQLNHFVDGNPTVFDHPALISPLGSLAAANCVVGTSDEPFYMFATANNIHGYFPNSNTHSIYPIPGANVPPDTFAKKGTKLYAFFGPSGGAFARHFVVYNMAGGTYVSDWAALTGFSVACANATDTRLVCLCFDTGTSAPFIKKLSLVDGTVMESISLNNITPKRTFAISDTLVYILTNTAMYYTKGSDLIFVGRVISPTLSAFGGNGIFSGGNFYYGQTGFGDSNAQIYKVAMPCPPGGPLIASISTGPTVVHGAAINVSWDGILDPTAGDSIVLRPAPVGGALGFTGSALATLSTSGPASGTLAFSIPGITTPGNYIFQLTRDSGSILIATSNVFAVT